MRNAISSSLKVDLKTKMTKIRKKMDCFEVEINLVLFLIFHFFVFMCLEGLILKIRSEIERNRDQY